jgi:uncharacterized protein (TIGR03118 family)
MDPKGKIVRWITAGLAATAMAIGAVSCGGGGGNDNNNNNNMPPVMMTRFAATSLVSDGGVPAAHTDPNLVNGWGVAFNPVGFAWVAANGTNTAILYDGNGVPQSLVVAIPPAAIGDARPTGIVFNGTQDFQVAQNGVSSPSAFIFVGESGTVAGWSPQVNPTTAIKVFDGGTNGPVYKGLAIASFQGANYLYAADFRNNNIDVFNASFVRLATFAGKFRDPGLPAGFAPFGIQAIGDRIYVAYAQQAAGGIDEAAGAGLGLIDVFDTGGTFIQQLVATGGALNAPWGMALAPDNFGSFSNDLLVGNFGDGKINAYNALTGNFDGTLSKTDGTPIVIDGLWGIAFGNGINSQPVNTLFFAAGPASETHGQYGRIDMQ